MGRLPDNLGHERLVELGKTVERATKHDRLEMASPLSYAAQPVQDVFGHFFCLQM